MTDTIKGPGRGLDLDGNIIVDENMYHREILPGSENFAEIFTAWGGDYEWAEFRCWYDTQAHVFYWLGQSGCSCHDFGVDSLGDLSAGSRADALAALKHFLAEHDFWFDGRKRAELPARLRNVDVRKIERKEVADADAAAA